MNNNKVKSIPNTTNSPIISFSFIFNFIVYFSPIILVCIIVSMSFIFQNFKGFIYLAYLIGCCLIREYIYYSNRYTTTRCVRDHNNNNNNNIYSRDDNTFNLFVFSFTILYVCLPMFISNSINYWIFSLLLAFFSIDLFTKIYFKFKQNCNLSSGLLVLNILSSATLATTIVALMYIGGSSKYLFFNEISTGKDICYKPSNQTFKCQVYKNGELVGNA